MNNCSVCNDRFQYDNPNKVICDGFCRLPFHAECANFSKNALMYYREMPNLQWFCDGCIIQMRSSNFSPANMSEYAHEEPRQLNRSSALFHNLKSTVVNRTSSPIYVQHPLIAAKRKPIPNPKSSKSSVFFASKLSNVKHNIGNANDSMRSPPSENEMQLEYHLVKPLATDVSKSLSTSIITQSDVSLPKPQNNAGDSDLTSNKMMEGTELETPPTSSFAEVVAKSSIAEQKTAKVKNTTISPSPDDSVLAQSMVLPFDSQKVVYVSNIHPSVTEKEVVNYLLSKNVISSPDDVLCKKLVSRNVNLDNVSFISFKITVNSEIFESVVNDKLWPQNVIAREFEKR